MTSEDIGAAPKEHIHDIMKKIPEIKEENAGKSLIVNGMGTGCEWETVSGVPVGAIIAWAGNTPPIGYLECNGATLRKETYPGLFAAIGTLWGSESEDTFKLPDFYSAARFLRSRSDGLDVGEVQEDAIRNIIGSTSIGESHGFYNSNVNPDNQGAFVRGKTLRQYGNAGATGVKAYDMEFDASHVVPTAEENRPKSAVVMYCIKVTDKYVNPEQVNISEVANALANKADRIEVRELAGMRLWVSEKYQPISNTLTIVEHGLDIEAVKCKWDVILVCVEAEQGYNVGDTAINPGSVPGSYLATLVPSLSSSSIMVMTNINIQSTHKITGQSIGLMASKWRYVFRIWY